MFRKLLVPFDGSETAQWVLERAGRLLAAPEVTVQLVTVADPGRERSRNVPWEALRLLPEVVDGLGKRGIPARSDVRRGDPAESLLERARGGAFDLVLMGTHTRPGPDTVFFGGVARRLLEDSQVPLLLFRPFLRKNGTLSPAAPRSEAPLSRILVLLDGTRLSEEALAPAAELAAATGARIHLCAAGRTVRTEDGRERAGSDYLDDRTAVAAERGARVEPRVFKGAPEREAQRMLEAGTVDTLAVVTQTRRRIANRSYDRIAGTLLPQATVPILAVPHVRTAAPAPDAPPPRRRARK